MQAVHELSCQQIGPVDISLSLCLGAS